MGGARKDWRTRQSSNSALPTVPIVPRTKKAITAKSAIMDSAGTTRAFAPNVKADMRHGATKKSGIAARLGLKHPRTDKGDAMAYRVQAQFRDGSASAVPADVIAASSPRCGDVIYVSRHGHDVPVRVIAVRKPVPLEDGRDVVVTVEARED